MVSFLRKVWPAIISMLRRLVQTPTRMAQKFLSESFMESASVRQHQGAGDQHVEQGQRQAELPAARHHLVVARAGQGGAQQDEQHDEEEGLDEEVNEAEEGVSLGARPVPAAEVQ